jgi:hypothetical protein
MLISMAGFKFPSEDERVLKKAIVNTIALCLAGQFAQIDSHSRLPRECLLFRNETRSLEVLAGQRNLERKCRQQLKQRIPEDLPAIEALLNAFPSARAATDKGRGRAHPAVRPAKKSRTPKQRPIRRASATLPNAPFAIVRFLLKFDHSRVGISSSTPSA